MARFSSHRFQLDAAATLDGHVENCTNRVAEEFKRTLPGIEIAEAGIQTRPDRVFIMCVAREPGD